MKPKIVLSSVSVFCEDIREVKSGLYTLTGIFPDNVEIPSVPVIAPKLCLYVRSTLSLDDLPNLIENHLAVSWQDEPIILGRTVVKEAFFEDIRRTREKGQKLLTLMTKLIMGGFEIKSAGTLEAVTIFDETPILAGVLNFTLKPQQLDNNVVGTSPA